MEKNTSTEIFRNKSLILIIAGYIILYGTFELTAKLTGDTINPLNALLISVCVLNAAAIAEVLLFKTGISDLVKFLV